MAQTAVGSFIDVVFGKSEESVEPQNHRWSVELSVEPVDRVGEVFSNTAAWRVLNEKAITSPARTGWKVYYQSGPE